MNEFSAEQQRQRSWRYRLDTISVLGGKCAKCGFTDPRALQIDHVNGGGSQERKRRGRSNAALAFLRQVREDTSGKYQLLCANCNWIKRYERGETAGNHRRLVIPPDNGEGWVPMIETLRKQTQTA